jgi:DNA-binding transcriptional LysR family regulator
VRRFSARHPGVRIVVDDCAPDQFMARITGEQVDFGIGSPEGLAAGVDLHPLMRDALSVVVPRGHALAARKTVRWAELAGWPVITVRPGYGIRSLIDVTAARAGVTLRVVNDVTFLSTALWMTRSGLGVSIMPSAFATRLPDAALAVRPLTAPRVSRDLVLVTKRGRSLPLACEGFVRMLRAEVARPQVRQRAIPDFARGIEQEALGKT